MNIVVDGYNICVKTTGTGDKTVVILQGWGTDLGVYDSVAGAIDGSRYRVIQFDFPGLRTKRSFYLEQRASAAAMNRRNPGMWTDLRIFSADLWK